MVEVIARIEAPVLLIAGRSGERSIAGGGLRWCRAQLVEVWAVPDAPHIGALATHPTEYRERVLTTFERSLLE